MSDVGAATVKHSWVAFVLGLPFPGLGHVHAGEPRRGVAAMFLACLVLAPGAFIALVLLSVSRAGLVLGGALLLVAALAVPIDGALRARKAGGRSRPRWWTYPAFAGLTIAVVVAAGLWGPHRLWYRTYRIPSDSMRPTLTAGDMVFADVSAVTRVSVARGDVVVFESPPTFDKLIVKRVVGLPGDTVESSDGRLWVNGEARTEDAAASTEPHLRAETLDGHRYFIEHKPGDAFGPVTVPDGSLFVLGDNRPQSLDSRGFGPVPMSTVHGRLLRVWFSVRPASGGVRWERIPIDLTASAVTSVRRPPG